MALDAATLALTAAELKTTLADAKIAKLFEPTRDELVITLRTRTLRQFTIGIGQRRQRFAGQAREMLAQHLRAVAVGLGKYDVDAHGQRLSGLNAVHQPGNQVARPGPLPVFDQALAVDANDDDRLVVP